MEQILNGQNQSDEIAQWVCAALAGSQAAFTQLYQRHLPLVHVILLGRYRRAVAEELAQECFVRAFGSLSQVQNQQQFGPWIATIARRMRSQASAEA